MRCGAEIVVVRRVALGIAGGALTIARPRLKSGGLVVIAAKIRGRAVLVHVYVNLKTKTGREAI